MMSVLMLAGLMFGAEAMEDRKVLVRASILTPAGEALPDSMVSGTTSVGGWQAKTDGAGDASAEVWTTSAEGALFVRMGNSAWAPDFHLLTKEERRVRNEAFLAKFEPFFWPEIVEAVIVKIGEETIAVASFRGVEAVRMTGEVRFADSTADSECLVKVRGSAAGLSRVRNGKFDVAVARGQAGAIELITNDGRRFWPGWTAAEAKADFVLQPVDVPALDNPGSVRGQVEEGFACDPRSHVGTVGGATLLHADGSFAVVLREDAVQAISPKGQDANAAKWISTHLQSLPAGVYFVAPGGGRLSECGIHIRDALKAGVDVEAKWGVPRVVIESGKETSFTLESGKVFQAVMGYSAPRIDRNKSALVTTGDAPAPAPAK